MIATFLDTGVLIEAYRASGPLGPPANAILGDTNRSFLASSFLRLELLPKATFHRQMAEVAFYQGYFAKARMVGVSDALIQRALLHAESFGLNAMDALHIAAAEIGGAAEFVTTERATSPLLRVTILHVISLHP